MEDIDELNEHDLNHDCLADLLKLADESSPSAITNLPSSDIGLDFLLENLCNVSSGDSSIKQTYIDSNEGCEFSSRKECCADKNESSFISLLDKASNDDLILSSLFIDVEKTSDLNIRNRLKDFDSLKKEEESTLLDFLLSDTEKDGHLKTVIDNSANFNSTLASLYLSEEPKTDENDQSKLSNKETNEQKIQHNLNSDSGYSSEKNDNDIDLTPAKITTLPTILQKPNYSDLVKKKPSLFSKVLCAKVNEGNISTVPKLPKHLPDILESLNYWKYFQFDTLSPDDIVKQKQKKILWKLH